MKLSVFSMFSVVLALPLRLFAADEPYSVPSVIASTVPVVASTETVVVEPYVWPVAKKLDGKAVRIVSVFGTRKSPKDNSPEVHEGLDFGVPVGTPVKVSRSGRVIFAGFSKMYVQRADKKQQNRLVIVRHSDGSSTRYVHLNIPKVKPPQDVKAGQVIAVVAESDEREEPVLHFELRDKAGRAVNPVPLFDVTEKP